MKRMVNVRLLDFFDQKRTLSTLQGEGRAKQTTFDQVLSLEVTVRKAQAHNEQVVSIFFDMEKSYDLAWRHGILMDIHEAGIEGRLFKFIQNFLKPRSFKVKVNEILYDTKVQTEGIPQGSVVSPTFFHTENKQNCSLIAERQRSPDILLPSRLEGCPEKAPGQ